MFEGTEGFCKLGKKFVAVLKINLKCKYWMNFFQLQFHDKKNPH